jgi:hypothetical protein
MAAPNLKQPITITGKTGVYSATATLANALSNGPTSNELLKVNVIRAANLTSGTASVDITVFRSSAHTYVIKSATVAPNTSLIILDKNEYLYLEEGDALYAKANAVSTIDLTIHYEKVS